MSANPGALRVAPNAHALACLAAGEILERAARSIALRGEFHLALAGGSTPRATYLELAQRVHAADWPRWQVWFGDERCVPPQHPDSNYGMAAEAWLHAGLVPADRIHRLRGEVADVDDEARRYELELRRTLHEPVRLDFVLLGLGADGHTASLFPGAAALMERKRLVIPARAPRPPLDRLTLTLPALNAARSVLFLASGHEKASALAAARAPGGDRSAPANLVRPSDGELSWIVDRAAAGQG